MDTFSPRLTPNGMPNNFQPTTLDQQFNDGYTATATIGINYDMRALSPSWVDLPIADAQYIENFLTAQKGSLRFIWKPYPDRPAGIYRCKKFTSKRKKGNLYDIDADFTQVG